MSARHKFFTEYFRQLGRFVNKTNEGTRILLLMEKVQF